MNSSPEAPLAAVETPSIRQSFLSHMPVPTDFRIPGDIQRNRLVNAFKKCKAMEKYKDKEALLRSQGWRQRTSLLPFAYMPEFHSNQHTILLKMDDLETDMSFVLASPSDYNGEVRNVITLALSQEPEHFEEFKEEVSGLQTLIDLSDFIYWVQNSIGLDYNLHIGIGVVDSRYTHKVQNTTIQMWDNYDTWFKRHDRYNQTKKGETFDVKYIVETPCAFRMVTPAPLSEDKRNALKEQWKAEEEAKAKEEEKKKQEEVKRRILAKKQAEEAEKAAAERKAKRELELKKKLEAIKAQAPAPGDPPTDIPVHPETIQQALEQITGIPGPEGIPFNVPEIPVNDDDDEGEDVAF